MYLGAPPCLDQVDGACVERAEDWWFDQKC